MTGDQTPVSSQSSSSQQGGGAFFVSDDLRNKFPDLIDLIVHSESMNDEERQYWIDILSVMTPGQISQLKDILENEKKQLAAIDAKYAQEMKNIGQRHSLEQVSEERHQRIEQLQSKEQADRTVEEKSAEKLLQDID